MNEAGEQMLPASSSQPDPRADTSSPTQTVRLTDDIREQLLGWLRANDLDPDNIPTSARMSWVDGKLTTDVLVIDENGRKQVDPATGNTMARETKTFPTTEPPPLVAAWLLPRCPTCGR
jgi:hypothetical protein